MYLIKVSGFLCDFWSTETNPQTYVFFERFIITLLHKAQTTL